MKTEYIIQIMEKGSDIWSDPWNLGNPYKTYDKAKEFLAKRGKNVNYEYRIVRRTEEVVDFQQ